MNAKICSAAVLGALLAAGLAGSADAASTRVKNQAVRVAGYPAGMFFVAPGDSVARINRTYPLDPNPPSLRQQYDLRGLKTQEFTH
jgi:hypothetical protein